MRERSITRDLVTLAAAVIFFVGLALLASIVVPLLAAIFLVLAFLPMLGWLQGKGLSRLWSAAIVIATVLVGALGIMLLVLISVAELADNLPDYDAQLQQRMDALATNLSDVGINVSGEALSRQINLSHIIDLVLQFLPGVVATIGAVVLSLLIFVYAVIDLDGARRRLRRGLGDDDAQLARLSTLTQTVSRYITIRVVLGGAAALLDLVLLLLVGVEFALLWAFVSFVMSFVPYIGYWVALIPPFLLALAEYGWGAAAIVFFGYWLINGTIDNFVGPRMLGEGLNIAPAVTVVAIVFWGTVLGPTGAILAMPLTVAVKLLLLERNPDSRWLALLISAHDTDIEPAVEASTTS